MLSSIRDSHVASGLQPAHIVKAMGGVTVLVVDDDEAIRVSLGDILTCEGYHVLYAENGVQAMHLVRSARPQLVLLDLMMPVMSGWEVLEEMQASADLARIPVIVVSAMCAPGVSACIQKPVDLGHLLNVVGELSGGPHKQEGVA